MFILRHIITKSGALFKMHFKGAGQQLVNTLKHPAIARVDNFSESF